MPGETLINEPVRRSAISTEQRLFFANNGYLILPRFFDSDRLENVKHHIDDLWESRRTEENPVVIDSYFGQPNGRREYFRDAGDDVRHLPYKLLDLHLVDPVIQDLGGDQRLLEIVSDLLTSTAVVINTLLFERGSQQDAHFDTFYMPSLTTNMMAASWIAIDRVTPENGPLFYYPGSHLIPPFRFPDGGLTPTSAEGMRQAEEHMRRIIHDHGLQQTTLLAAPGDVLIWHAQLMHGGSLITDPDQKRTSLVTHYWTKHDLPGAEDTVEFAPGRLMFRRPHHRVVDPAKPPNVDDFIAKLVTPPSDKCRVPEDFDARAYLIRNPDVLAAQVDPYTHYVVSGRTEGRLW